VRLSQGLLSADEIGDKLGLRLGHCRQRRLLLGDEPGDRLYLDPQAVEVVPDREPLGLDGRADLLESGQCAHEVGADPVDVVTQRSGRVGRGTGDARRGRGGRRPCVGLGGTGRTGLRRCHLRYRPRPRTRRVDRARARTPDLGTARELPLADGTTR
jgi:hypothetical protein